MLRPHFGHSSSSGMSGTFLPWSKRRVVLQSGYPVQAMNWPERPPFSTITRPQFSQYSSCVVSCTSAESRSGKLMGFSLVKVQLLGSSLSYELPPENEPCLPHLI